MDDLAVQNIALLVGNSEYKNCPNLDCCEEDVTAIARLLEVTEKYDTIKTLVNMDAALLKDTLRSALDNTGPIEELFLYFSGHGHLRDGEFFMNATDFDVRRPHETGLSQTELHTLLRATDSSVIVKVVDACSSGTPLIKAEVPFPAIPKDGFKNVIQIASCLDSQSSLTGNPLSTFTQYFYDAALRKDSGTIYYSDIVSTLRDMFLDNESQTPHFVSQGTGREVFVPQAAKLSSLRVERQKEIESLSSEEEQHDDGSVSEFDIVERVRRLSERYVNQDVAEQFIATLFDEILSALPSNECDELYEVTYIEHSQFEESVVKEFVARALHSEKRRDKLVTAVVSREDAPNTLNSLVLGLGNPFSSPPNWITTYVLQLNCQMEKIQLKISLEPKYKSLKKFSLIVTCAPSVETCYVFGMAFAHSLEDWDSYEDRGQEIDRNWYKLGWNETTDGIAEQLSELLLDAVHEHIQDVVAQSDSQANN